MKINATRPVIAARFFSLSFLAVFFMLSCRKDNSVDTGAPVTPPDLSTKINSAVSGFVTDENDLPVKSAAVAIGSAVINTDKYGYFEVKNIEVIKDAATVSVSKTGYFKAIKTYMAATGKAAFFRIKLIPKTLAGTINSSSGGTVTLTNGLSINLPAGSVVNAATNIAYTGTINVAASWINPAAADINRIMPGDLRGINIDGNAQLLTTYGMAAVELTGTGGEQLQVATGKKAVVTFPIPPSLVAAAPLTIPLWYFDETKGLWKQEGSASKNGSTYSGEVSHFSYWNCDVPNSYVQFNCTLVNQSSQPIPNALVKISMVSNPANARSGYTDSLGYTGGAIPDNAQLLMEVFSPSGCVIYSQPFTTGSTSISLGTVTVNTSSFTANITGTVTNCAGQPVTNGFVYAKLANQYTRYNLSGGAFNFNILQCASPLPVSVFAEDVAGLQQSAPANYTVSTGNNAIGNIQACGVTTQQYFNYTINGVPYNISVPGDTITIFNTQVHLVVYAQNTSNNPLAHARLEFIKVNMAVGSTQGIVSFSAGQLPDSTLFPGVVINITEYGNIGEYISGNFSGVFTGPPSTNTPYNVTCTFRIKRYF